MNFTNCTGSNTAYGRMTVNDELEGLWTEVVMAYFKVVPAFILK
jgi:hypothetical protein